ncbi:MAG: ABC transporter ATP-binding protein [Firmicutes bacterium]|nr:ABC transporter ATP-binding protein [Bacillota bacterium]
MAETNKNDVVLSVKDLHVYFYTNQRCNKVLRGVSFDIKRGKTLCVVGESGCGKSVTANSILRLLPELSRIESGSITYYREDGSEVRIDQLQKNGREMRRLRGQDIAIIFQDPMTALNPVYTVGHQIREMISEHKTGLSKAQLKKESIEDLADMGIPAAEIRDGEYPHQFSGGMRQRAMIAMGMSCEPKILLADEPTTALDVTISAQIFDLMNDLKKEHGTAIMMITHNMGVVAEMADDVAVMYMGNIVEYGKVEDVFTNPAHPYTKALLQSIPVLGKGKNQQLEPIRGVTPDPFNRPKGCQFCPRCDYACEKCETEMPPEEWVTEGHYTRCFKYREVIGSGE